MSWRDYCEPGPWDDDEQDEATVTCKYCGRDELFWVEIEEGKWRLADADGDVHSCHRADDPKIIFALPLDKS